MKRFFPKKEAKIPFTAAGHANILAERTKLMCERPEAVENLRKSREMGDLSENGYYKASRARLSFLDGRIRRIDRLIRLGVVVTSANSGHVDIGSTIIISDGKTTKSYTLVGGYESDPNKNTVSHFSPIGKAMLGKTVGESFEVQAPRGVSKYTIISIN